MTALNTTNTGAGFLLVSSTDTPNDPAGITSYFRTLSVALPHSPLDLMEFAAQTDLLELIDSSDVTRFSKFYWDPAGNLRWLLTKGNIYIHPMGGTGNGTVYMQTDLKVGDPTNPNQGGTIEHSGRINAFYDPIADKPALWLGNSTSAPADGKLDYVYVDSSLSSSYNFLRFRKAGSDVLRVSDTGQIVQNVTYGPLAGGFVATYGTNITATVNQGATASSQSFAYALNVQTTTPVTDSGVLGSLTAFNGRATHNSTGKANTIQGSATTADAHGPAGTLYGTFGTAYANNPVGTTVDTMNGAFGNVAMFDAGNVTAMYGVTGWVSFINNTGLATTAATFRSRQPQLFSGSTPPTSLYGVLIEPHTIGSTSWNLYSQGATTKNYFEGQVGIGTSNPTAGKQLHVVGNTQLDGAVLHTVTGSVLTATGFQKPWNQTNITTAQGSTPYGTNASPVGNYFTLTVPATDSVAPLGLYGTYTMVEHYGTALLGNPFGTYTTLNVRAGSGGSTSAIGSYAQVNTDGSAPSGAAWGVAGYAWHNNAGANAPSDLVGVVGRINFFGNDTRPAQASTFRAVAPRSLSSGLGATNLYGLLIDDHSLLAGTNNYNIYSLGANSRNYFQGQVGIGTSNPTAGKQLHVVGNTQLDGSLVQSRTGVSSLPLGVTTAVLDITHKSLVGSTASGILAGLSVLLETDATDTGTYQSLPAVGVTLNHRGSGKANLVRGFYASVFTQGYSGTQWGVQVQSSTSGAGYVDNLYGMGIAVIPQGSSANVITTATGLEVSYAHFSTQPVTTLYGVRVKSPSIGSSTLGTNYGLYVDDQTFAGGTSYNIVSKGVSTKNLFEGTVTVQGALNVPTKTPTSTADASGTVGDQAWDDSYVYVKTSAGWKRSALATF